MTHTATNVEIREHPPDELALWVGIGNASMPADMYTTLEQARVEMRLDRPEDPPVRLLAWIDGQAVATGYCGRSVFSPEGRFRLGIRVLPEFRRRGVGGALYQRLLLFARERDALSVAVQIHEHCLYLAQNWLEREQFHEVERMRPSELRIDDLDFDSWADAEARPVDQGITFTTLAEEDSEQSRRKLWELSNLTARDVPHDTHEDQSFEIFSDLLDRPEARPDCLVIAKDGDQYVGFTLLVHQTDERALTGMTGVRRDYRNRGIALALKLRCARLARKRGYTAMRTFNHVNNPSMLAVNTRLGYRPLPEVIAYRKELKG